MTDKPAVIVAATMKGKGVSFIEDKDGWHGKALKKGEELDRALAELEREAACAHSKVKPAEGRDAARARAVASGEFKLSEYISRSTGRYARGLRRGACETRATRIRWSWRWTATPKNSTYSEKFMKAHPERFFESFIAEQNMVGAAVGLGAMGKIPFASTFACFLTRAYDHIRMAAISQANLKLCGSHAGVSIGEDGPSQMALEDLAMMRAIEARRCFIRPTRSRPSSCSARRRDIEGIVYIRTSRPKTPVIYSKDEQFEIGRAKVIRQSDEDKATIVYQRRDSVRSARGVRSAENRRHIGARDRSLFGETGR